MLKSNICAKLYNLIRLSQKGSYSADAALQMWRIESSLILSADLIGVTNPEDKNIANGKREMKTAQKPPRSNVP